MPPPNSPGRGREHAHAPAPLSLSGRAVADPLGAPRCYRGPKRPPSPLVRLLSGRPGFIGPPETPLRERKNQCPSPSPTPPSSIRGLPSLLTTTLSLVLPLQSAAHGGLVARSYRTTESRPQTGRTHHSQDIERNFCYTDLPCVASSLSAMTSAYVPSRCFCPSFASLPSAYPAGQRAYVYYSLGWDYCRSPKLIIFPQMAYVHYPPLRIRSSHLPGPHGLLSCAHDSFVPMHCTTRFAVYECLFHILVPPLSPPALALGAKIKSWS
ncbi:unnamed protein product [Pleuronectes platessa]|uniref:Uncharacterized protein n=1 Tax=Pleuronectes platessa TaxID=8262 RepID=A0A9N7W3I6_PLEPL|nr:unnamed protein product [Pleuronectes platessa]